MFLLIALLFICSVVWFVKCINGAATVDENDCIIPKDVLEREKIIQRHDVIYH